MNADGGATGVSPLQPGRRSLSGPGITSEVNAAQARHEVPLSGISMAANSLDRQLTQLADCRYRFGPGEAARVVKLLKRLDAARFPDSASLIRFHEALLFLRAFPHGPVVVRITERILDSFHKKVEALRKAGADMDDFDTLRSLRHRRHTDGRHAQLRCCQLARQHRRMPSKVEIAWENYEPGRELGTHRSALYSLA